MIQTDLCSFSYKKGSLVPWCKQCGAENFYGDGHNERGLRRYKCRPCGFRFVWTSDLPRRRVFSHISSFAVKLYTDLRKGISLRGIAELLKEIFDVSFTYEAVRQWILSSKKIISRREIAISTVWHADETYIKIKGVGHWLWIVYCAETKFVLAWRISKGRFFNDAKAVLKKALDVAGERPTKVITDGLWQYAAALKKVMHWRLHERKRKHVVDSGIGKNALIERVNREVKRRIKWFSTFQSLEGAEAFFSLWFYHYNRRALSPPT